MADGGQRTDGGVRNAKVRGFARFWKPDYQIGFVRTPPKLGFPFYLSRGLGCRKCNLISDFSISLLFLLVPKQYSGLYRGKTVTPTSEYIADTVPQVASATGHCPYALILTSINLNGQLPWIHFDRSQSASDQ
jgi:hypothetical protein